MTKKILNFLELLNSAFKVMFYSNGCMSTKAAYGCSVKVYISGYICNLERGELCL